MFDRSEIHTGMTVRSHDGYKLGRVVEITADELIVEKGLLWRRSFAVPLSGVREVLDGEVLLSHGRDSLFSAPRELPHRRHAPSRGKPPVVHMPSRQRG